MPTIPDAHDLATRGRRRPRRHIGLFLFDGVEELDAVGPWEVLASWTQQHPEDGWDISCLSADGGPSSAPRPWSSARTTRSTTPGSGRPDPSRRPRHQAAAARPRPPDWVRGQRATVPLMTSVCTGSLVYAAAGLLVGRRATTHWASLNLLSELDPTVITDVDARFVDDGDLITSAGVSAGIDMALHLVARLAGAERAREVRRDIQYDPQPPV